MIGFLNYHLRSPSGHHLRTVTVRVEVPDRPAPITITTAGAKGARSRNDTSKSFHMPEDAA